MTISQAQIDQLHTSAASALNSLNIAYGAQALAETLPLIGTGLGTSSSDATQVMENTRTALLNALSTLSGAATYTAAQVEIEINNALASIGMSGVVVGVQVSGSDITLSINAEAGETSQFAVAGDIGLPGIAVSVAGSADVAASAALSLTMGLDSAGFFIDTAASGIDLSLGTTGVTFDASASLGVLQYVVADAGTELDLDFAIDLTDANNDGLLRLSEMGQDFLDVSLNGQADIGLAMAADFGTGALPSVSAVLEIDWQFINAAINPIDQNVTFGELPSVVLKDVTLDLGSFLENVMLPIFDAIAPLIDPINTALEVITADITMLKLLPNWETLLDLSGDGEINMLDLLKLADPDIDLGPIEDFIDLAKDIVDWAEFLDSVAVGEAGLNFGDFKLDTAEDLRDLAFDITTANLDLQGAADTLTDVVDALSGGEWTNSSGGTSPQEMLQEMVSGTAFSVPILEDPAQILSLLFGGEADLIEIDFPEVAMSAGGDSLLTIPVFTGITVNIGGSISAAFDLAFGYSTRGLTMPGASALTALNGLYVIDGEGPEASLSATINLGAALDAVIVSLYGGGAVTGTIELDIADGLQSQPGRLYYDEFLAALSTNPFSLFDASGSITAHLTLAARVLGGDIFRIDSPQITLADFNFTGVSSLASSTSTLALASLSGGVLTLNTGPLAGDRLVGSAVDGNEIAYISDATGGKVNVVIDGYAEAYSSGTLIAADLGLGNDQLVLSETLAIAGSIEGGEGRDILAGGAAGDTLDGGIGEDTLFGRDGNDSLIGGDGADLFYGGAGADTLSGGDGEDMVSYVYSAIGVNVNLGTGTGSGGTAQGDVLTSIEVLQGSNDADTLTGSGNGEMIIGLDGDDSVAGAGGDDVLLGSDGNDTLDGGTGADTMVGAQGDDLYFVDDTGDVVDENRYGEIPAGTDGGTDEVRAAISWSIATGTQSQIENLTLIGAAISGTGNAGDNVITANQLGLSGGSLYGGGGSDTLHGSGAGEWLDGQAGADSMIGHGGNDTYFVDNLSDDIVEVALEGSDTAISRLQSFALDAADDIEVLALDAAVLNGALTGNALDQTLIGASGNDTLEGLGGADALIGGIGRDRATYRSSTVAVSIDLTLAAQIGDDAAGDTYTSIEEIEGSELADTLIGDDGDNAFLGLGGDDTLRGNLGNDTLLGGSGHDSLDGGVGADYLDGDAGNDSLDGGQDADTLIGGNGDDTYVVDHALEQVTELGTGTDLVQAWVDWSLDAPSQLNIENLTLLGAARSGTGNALANTLIGTAGNDRLDGLLGRDTMIGGAGDDTYVVDNVLDMITDSSGHDLIEVRAVGASSFDMSVQAVDVEDLNIAGTSGAVRITGNDLNNVITGNTSGDTISGGLGNDTIIAGDGGREILSGDEGDDDLRLTLLSRGTHYVHGGEGTADIMRMDWSTSTSGITYYSNSSSTYYRTYADAYVYTYFDGIESFDLRGGSASDVLYGGNLADTLVGNGGSDRLYGYRGALEVSGGAGHDLVYATVRTAEDVDLGLDFSLRLLDTQTGPVIVNAGTAVETSWEGIEQVRMTTGAGNDLLDTRNVSSSSNVFGASNYWNSGDGDDHYLTDLGALGSANFLAGDGIDTLTIDWGAATSGITYYSNSSTTYYRVYVEGYGYAYQYFSDIEKIDFTTGSASDMVYAVGGRDRFVTNGGQDRIFGADKGDTVLAGDGNDWVSLDLRFGDGETDPAEDIDVTLSALQDEAAVFYEGTEDETHLQGVEQMYLYTGAGNDRFDTRGVASSSNWFGYSNYISLGDGDDHYLTDLGALGSANFLAGDGIDTLTIDWGAATSGITYYSNSSTTYYRVYVEGYGYAYQYFSNVEIFDLTGGSGADSLLGGSLTDRLIGDAGNDTLRAGSGNDFVQGGTGHDLIVLGAGDDTAFGEAGNDTIIGSLGSDVNVAAYSGSAASIYVIDLGEGSYQVITEAGGSDLLQNIQTLRFDDGLVTTDYAITSLVNTAPVLPEPAEATLVAGQTTAIFDAEATDPEGHPVTYSLAGADAGLFAIDPLTGEVTFDGDPTLALPEAAAGGLIYSLEILASDGYASGSQELTVTGISNSPPEAVSDLATTNQSAPISVDVLANDFDLEGPAPTLAGFGQPEHGSVTQAGDSLVYQPDAGFYGVDQFVYDIVDAQGLSSSGEVVINVNRVLERLDSENLASWQSQTTVISPTGKFVSRVITYDDGRISTSEYTNGVRTTHTLTDPENAHRWSSRTDTFDVDGTLLSSVSVYDDGRLLTKEYTAGVQTTQTLTDPENAHRWANRTDTFDSAGALFSSVTTYDDGHVLTKAYNDGVQTTQTLTDPENAHRWNSRTDTFDVGGTLLSSATIYDDGRVLTKEYTAGIQTAQILTDSENAHVWSDRTYTFDAEGNVISGVTRYDDGRVADFRYVSGVQSNSSINDVADAFVWATIERDYDSVGVLTESKITYDDGKISTTEFVDGIRSIQTLTDPENAYVWTDRTDVFDGGGALISRLTHFDDGSVQTWPEADDSPI